MQGPSLEQKLKQKLEQKLKKKLEQKPLKRGRVFKLSSCGPDPPGLSRPRCWNFRVIEITEEASDLKIEFRMPYLDEKLWLEHVVSEVFELLGVWRDEVSLVLDWEVVGIFSRVKDTEVPPEMRDFVYNLRLTERKDRERMKRRERERSRPTRKRKRKKVNPRGRGVRASTLNAKAKIQASAEERKRKRSR